MKDLLQLEADATAIANFEPMLIPGLLQTAEYASGLFQGLDSTRPAAEVNALIATRMARQAILTGRDATVLHAIVDEMVLRRPIGEPGVMRRQLEHLLSSTERPNIRLQVVPFSVGASPALRGPFMIVEMANLPSVVHNEANAVGVFMSEEQHVRSVQQTWQRLRAIALSPERTRMLLTNLLGEMP